nr:hypothetical protein CFP56_43037 [Quercus suber]
MCSPMFKTEGRSQERTSKYPCPVVFVPAEKQKSKSPPCKGIGIVIRDVLGVVTAAQSIKVQPAKTSMEGQILAMVAGIQLALHQNCQQKLQAQISIQSCSLLPHVCCLVENGNQWRKPDLT